MFLHLKYVAFYLESQIFVYSNIPALFLNKSIIFIYLNLRGLSLSYIWATSNVLTSKLSLFHLLFVCIITLILFYSPTYFPAYLSASLRQNLNTSQEIALNIKDPITTLPINDTISNFIVVIYLRPCSSFGH